MVVPLSTSLGFQPHSQPWRKETRLSDWLDKSHLSCPSFTMAPRHQPHSESLLSAFPTVMGTDLPDRWMPAQFRNKCPLGVMVTHMSICLGNWGQCKSLDIAILTTGPFNERPDRQPSGCVTVLHKTDGFQRMMGKVQVNLGSNTAVFCSHGQPGL